MSFRRKLPKTVKYIEEEMDAVVLDGMQRSFNAVSKKHILRLLVDSRTTTNLVKILNPFPCRACSRV